MENVARLRRVTLPLTLSFLLLSVVPLPIAEAIGGWQTLNPSVSPPPLSGASMAQGPNGTTVLFGGCKKREFPTLSAEIAGESEAYTYPIRTIDHNAYWCPQNADGDPNNVSDATWVYNGQTWTQITKPAGATDETWPHARWRAHMTYDPQTGSLLLFGGLYQAINEPTAPAGAADCWGDYVEVEGELGSLLGIPVPGDKYHWERKAITYVYDADSPTTRYHSYCFNDTWSWNGSQWTKLTVAGASPDARYDAAFASGNSVCNIPGDCDGGRQGAPTLVGGCTGIGLWQNHSRDSFYWGCTRHGGTIGQVVKVSDTQTPKNTYDREVNVVDTWIWSSSGSSSGAWKKICPDASPGVTPCQPIPSNTTPCSFPIQQQADESLCAPPMATEASMGYDSVTGEMIYTSGFYYDPLFKYSGWLRGGAVWIWDSGSNCYDHNDQPRPGPCWRLVLSYTNHRVGTSCPAAPRSFYGGRALSGTVTIFGGRGDKCGGPAGAWLLNQEYTWDHVFPFDLHYPESGCHAAGSGKYATYCWNPVSGTKPTPRQDFALAYGTQGVFSGKLLYGGWLCSCMPGETNPDLQVGGDTWWERL